MSQLLGLTGIIYALYFALNNHGDKFTGYFDKSAAVLIALTPPCVMLLSHTLGDLFTGIKMLLSSIMNRQMRHQREVIETLTRISAMVRTDGLGIVAQVRNQVRYELLRDGLSLLINDFKVDEIRHNLMARINSKQTHMALAANLFENMSKLCPGIGMVGTLMGLIGMLSHLDDPTKLGGGMALAMVTTLYGLGVGTMVYGPLGEKISIEAEKTLETDLMVLDGLINIKNKKSSVHFSNLVKTYGGGRQQGGAQPAPR